MKRTRIYILGSLIAVLMGISTGCDTDFAEVNTNPNVPNSVTPNLLLPNVLRSAANEIVGTGWSIGNIVIQHTAKIQFVNEDRYLWGNINGIWNTTYGSLRELENMYTIAGSSVPVQSNYQGVALVLKSWFIALATDTYGDLPYSEATQGKTGVATPKYDTQEEIYTRLLSDLAKANDLLSPSNEAIQGDILFNGNALRWKKMANSLRLRYLMRISKKKDVKAEMQAILSNPQKFPIFENNAEQAALRFLPTVPNQFPPYTYRSGSIDEFRLSKTMEDQLKGVQRSAHYRFCPAHRSVRCRWESRVCRHSEWPRRCKCACVQWRGAESFADWHLVLYRRLWHSHGTGLDYCPGHVHVLPGVAVYFG